MHRRPPPRRPRPHYGAGRGTIARDAPLEPPTRRRRSGCGSHPPRRARGAGGAAALALLPARSRARWRRPRARPPGRAPRPGYRGHACRRWRRRRRATRPRLRPGLLPRNDFTVSTTYIGADGRPTAAPADAAYVVDAHQPRGDLARAAARAVATATSGAHRRSADERDGVRPGEPELETWWACRPLGAEVPDSTTATRVALVFNCNLEAVLPKDDPLSVLPDERASSPSSSRRGAEQRPEGPESNVRNTSAPTKRVLRDRVSRPALATRGSSLRTRPRRPRRSARSATAPAAARRARRPRPTDGKESSRSTRRWSRLVAEGMFDGVAASLARDLRVPAAEVGKSGSA